MKCPKIYNIKEFPGCKNNFKPINSIIIVGAGTNQVIIDKLIKDYPNIEIITTNRVKDLNIEVTPNMRELEHNNKLIKSPLNNMLEDYQEYIESENNSPIFIPKTPSNKRKNKRKRK